MGKNIVICCDGTGNEIETQLSNVLKLYRVLSKSEEQRVYYSRGVGTIGQQNSWQRFRQQTRGVFGLATGYGLDEDVLGAYRFLCQVYESGDRIWLFGFSRGAYTVRVLAAFLHVVGLVKPDQVNLAGYAFAAYKRASSGSWDTTRSSKQADTGDSGSTLAEAWHFGRVAGASPVRIEFIGVWDTVASVIVPRHDRIFPDLQLLRHTRTNSSVKFFRQAIAIDERRRMFRLNRWKDPQKYLPNPFQASSEVEQNIKQVWFAGLHADIGGGYAEEESGLSKFPLAWMIQEACIQGLLINKSMLNHLVYGQPREGSKHDYVAPNAIADMHHSLTSLWWILEWLPKRIKWREWTKRNGIFGWYLPRGEPRLIPEGAKIHRSVQLRMQGVQTYRPVNLPQSYEFVDTSEL